MTLKLIMEIISFRPDGNQTDLIDEYNFAYVEEQAEAILNVFISNATQRLIDAGYQPDGKAIKAIEGMRDD